MPQQASKTKKKQRGSNRKAINLANGIRNKANRARRAARNAIKNKEKGITSHKRSNGPSKQRRTAHRYLKAMWAFEAGGDSACAQ